MATPLAMNVLEEKSGHFIAIDLEGSHRVKFEAKFETPNLTYICEVTLPFRMSQVASPSKNKDYWASNPGQRLSISVEGTGSDYMGMLGGNGGPAAHNTDSGTCKKNLRLDKESDFYLVIDGLTVKVARFKAQCHDGDAGGILVPYYCEYLYSDLHNALWYAMKKKCYVLVIGIDCTIPKQPVKTANTMEKETYEKTFVKPVVEAPKNRFVNLYCTSCKKRYATAVHDNDADRLEKGAPLVFKCLSCHQEAQHMLVLHTVNAITPQDALDCYNWIYQRVALSPLNKWAFDNEYALLSKEQQKEVGKPKGKK